MLADPEAVRNLPGIWFKLRVSIVSLGRENGLRREQAGLDRGQNAFAALRVRQAGGIADQQKAVAGDAARGGSVEQISVSPHGRNWQRNPRSRAEEPHELLNALRKAARVRAPQTYIEDVAFAETPTIAFDVR